MMKKLLYIVTLMLIALPAQSQSALSNADTAALIIGRHYEITDYDAIPKDSMLFIESHIVYQDQPKDTLLMRRWYVWPNRFRLEITRQDSLLTGYRNDGKDEYMKYDHRKDDWAPVNINYYYNEMTSYDFRGPLYRWEANGGELRYEGDMIYQGHPVSSVYVTMPGMYDKHYLFEKESGLLFLINETNKTFERTEFAQSIRVDWRAFLEYEQVGLSLLVSKESYKKDGIVVTIEHHGTILPANDRIFTHNKRLTTP